MFPRIWPSPLRFGTQAASIFKSIVACLLLLCACDDRPNSDKLTRHDPQFTLGEQLADQCRGCHQLANGEHALGGPSLIGVFGRISGTGLFSYSLAMRGAAIEWNSRTLDAFLADPTGYVYGTYMNQVPIDDPKQRAAIIQYLHAVTEE
jgi:cytochrome c